MARKAFAPESGDRARSVPRESAAQVSTAALAARHGGGGRTAWPRIHSHGGLMLRFKSYGSLVADRWPTRLDMRMPFYYLSNQGFWRASTMENAAPRAPESCFLCEMDAEFFALLANPDFRLKARLLLVSRYF